MQAEDLVESIRKRAYQIWEITGRPEGRHLDHWLQAETEYRAGAAGRMPVSRAPDDSATQAPPTKARRPRQTAKRPKA